MLCSDKPDQEKAGGGGDCSTLAVSAFTTLLAGGDQCGQQDAADSMVDLAKQLGSHKMITLSQIFAQQPRNAVCRHSRARVLMFAHDRILL
jgi:hypothetical protein